ncbi:MAG TPA: ABC transporter permease [Thermoanaerobaculia bacterium]
MDIRYTLRLLFKSPAFTLLTVLVLTGGLTVSLFTFAFFYTIFYKPLPLKDSETILRAAQVVPLHEYAEARQKLSTFAEAGVWRDSQVRFSAGDDSQSLFGTYTEWNLFKFSRTNPLFGRALQAQDSEAGAAPVAVISYKLWQSHFSGSPSAVGRVIRLNNQDTEIVGIMPKDYAFPVATEIWLPFTYEALHPTATEFTFANFHGRLAPGMSTAQATQQLDQYIRTSYETRAKQAAETFKLRPDAFQLDTYQASQLGGGLIVDLAMYGINIASTLILLLAGINVGNMLLARAIARGKESAIRVALGAGERRLIGQLMWEGGIIVVAGTLLSLVFTSVMLNATTLYLSSAFGRQGATPFWWNWGLDKETLFAAIGFLVLTIFTVCYLPARKSARADVVLELRDGTRGAQGRRAGKLMRALVTAQIMFVSLIMCFGFLIFSLVRKGETIEAGYDLTNLMAADVTLPEDGVTDEQRAQTLQQLVQDLQGNAQIAEAFVWTPLGNHDAVVEGLDAQNNLPAVSVHQLLGTPEFKTLKLVEGRHFDHREALAAQNTDLRTAIVSQSFVEKRWGRGSAIGKRLQLDVEGKPVWYSVVGVTKDITQSFTEQPAITDEIYLSAYQTDNVATRVYFRSRGNASLAEETFYQSLTRIAPQGENGGVKNIAEQLGMSKRVMSLGQKVLFSCGLFALLLSLCGVYGITSNAIVQKTHEIGIRRALGATDREIIMLFLRQSMWQVGIGLGIGIGFAALVSWMAGAFFGFSFGFYVQAFAVVIFTVAIIVGVAVVLPSRRVAMIEPAVALRTE